MESWWMDSYYSNSGSIVDAINNGVTVEGYDWMHDYPDGNNNYYYSYGKYQKTMKKYGEIPDTNLRNALKALVPDVFDGDKVLTVAALNTSGITRPLILAIRESLIWKDYNTSADTKTSFWMEIIWEKSILVNTQSVPATRQVR